MMDATWTYTKPQPLDRLASASRNSAALVLWVAPLGQRRNCTATSPLIGLRSLHVEFLSRRRPSKFGRAGGARMGRFQSPIHIRGRRQAGAREQKRDDRLSRFLRSLRAESANRREPFEGASVGEHSRVSLGVLHCADEGASQRAGPGRYRKGEQRYARLKKAPCRGR